VLGKIIILCLIQIGGLGIMTFTGFFGYIFTTSGSSFHDRLLFKEIFSTESLNNLFKLLTKIIFLTFLTEMAGAIIIYFSLEQAMENRLMFSIFHAVSAFCNAGFSTLSDGLPSSTVRYNNIIHLSVAVLVILGGIGFPVLVNIYSYVKRFISILIRKIQRSRIPVKPEKKNILISCRRSHSCHMRGRNHLANRKFFKIPGKQAITELKSDMISPSGSGQLCPESG